MGDNIEFNYSSNNLAILNALFLEERERLRENEPGMGGGVRRGRRES